MPKKYAHINDETFNLRKGVLFYLYTRTNPKDPQQLFLNDTEGLMRSNFQGSKPTKFMTHGWKNYYLGRNCQTVKRGESKLSVGFGRNKFFYCDILIIAFLMADDYNVVLVDWSSISKLPYLLSVTRLNMIAKYVAEFVEYLQNHENDVKNMTLVGHSLGAQMMGLVAYNLKAKVGHVVGESQIFLIFCFYEKKNVVTNILSMVQIIVIQITWIDRY